LDLQGLTPSGSREHFNFGIYSVYLMGYTLYMPKAQMAKWGNSLAIRIPKAVAEKARLREGDSVEIRADKGRIELRRTEKIPTLEELVAQITPENRHPEVDWGPDVGREKIEW